MSLNNDQSENPHLFSLQPSKGYKFQGPSLKKTVVDFTPSLLNPHQLNPKKKKYSTIVPKYNADSLYYTPSFMIPFYDNIQNPKKKQNYQKVKLDNFNQYIEKLQKLIPEQTKNQEKTQEELKRKLAGPALKFDPGNENYCGICSTTFCDYWHHINGITHKKNITKKEANNYIGDLCRKYRLKNEHRLQSKTIDNQEDIANFLQQEKRLNKQQKISGKQAKQRTKPLSEREIEDKKIPRTIIPSADQPPTENKIDDYQLELDSKNQLAHQIFDAEHNQKRFEMFDSRNFLRDNYENLAEKKGVWSTIINDDYSKSDVFDQQKLPMQLNAFY